MEQISLKLDKRLKGDQYYSLDKDSFRGLDDSQYNKKNSLEESLMKNFKEKLALKSDVYNDAYLKRLISKLIDEIPLSHRNLLYIAASSIIVNKILEEKNITFTPELFERYINSQKNSLHNVKLNLSAQQNLTNFVKVQCTLLRYIRYMAIYLKE